MRSCGRETWLRVSISIARHTRPISTRALVQWCMMHDGLHDRGRETLRRHSSSSRLSLLIKERAAFDLGAEGRVSPNVHPRPDRLAILDMRVALESIGSSHRKKEAGSRKQEVAVGDRKARSARARKPIDADRDGRLPDSRGKVRQG